MTHEAITADYYEEGKATFGDRLTGAREAAGLTEAALAKQLGVKLKTLKGWEDNLAEPRANKLTMLAGILNVSLRWLLTGQGEDLVPSPAGVTAEELAAVRLKLTEALDAVARLEERLAHG